MTGKRERELDRNTFVAFATSDFYQLLSVSLHWPSDELSIAILDGSYMHDGMNILEELSCSENDLQQVKTAFEASGETAKDAAQLLKELRREYTRLFNHPVKPVLDIYESIFLGTEGGNPEAKESFLNPISVDVERFYQAAGLINQSSEPADHIVTELEFMMYLYRSKGKALQEQDYESAAKIDQQIQEFAAKHLGKWCHKFFDILEESSQVPFYKVVGKIAKSGLIKVLPCQSGIDFSN